MTSGMLFALAISALVVAVLVGLMRRQRSSASKNVSAEGPVTAAQWTEGETTRLLSSAELPGSPFGFGLPPTPVAATTRLENSDMVKTSRLLPR